MPDKKKIGCREFLWVSHVNIAFFYFIFYIFLSGCSQKLSLTVRFNRNAPKIRAHPAVRKGGCYEVHDIEDLVKVGEMVQGMVFCLHKLEFPFTQICLLLSGITFVLIIRLLIFWSTSHGRSGRYSFLPIQLYYQSSNPESNGNKC